MTKIVGNKRPYHGKLEEICLIHLNYAISARFLHPVTPLDINTKGWPVRKVMGEGGGFSLLHDFFGGGWGQQDAMGFFLCVARCA